MKQRAWKIPYEPPEVPTALISAGYQPLLAAVLAIRGIDGVGEAEEFLHCGIQSLLDPMGMRNMEKAVARVRRAIREH